MPKKYAMINSTTTQVKRRYAMVDSTATPVKKQYAMVGETAKLVYTAQDPILLDGSYGQEKWAYQTARDTSQVTMDASGISVNISSTTKPWKQTRLYVKADLTNYNTVKFTYTNYNKRSYGLFIPVVIYSSDEPLTEAYNSSRWEQKYVVAQNLPWNRVGSSATPAKYSYDFILDISELTGELFVGFFVGSSDGTSTATLNKVELLD